MLNVGKESLKNETDKRVCRHIESLKEFKKYIESTYIAGLSLIDDLLSDILKKSAPKNIEESISNIQEAVLCLNTIKKRDLTERYK